MGNMKRKSNTVCCVLFSILMFLSACNKYEVDSKSHVDCVPSDEISVHQAIAIGKEEMDKIGYQYLESEIAATWAHGIWSVLFIHSSLRIGAHVSVNISADGKVLELVGGN